MALVAQRGVQRSARALCQVQALPSTWLLAACHCTCVEVAYESNSRVRIHPPIDLTITRTKTGRISTSKSCFGDPRPAGLALFARMGVPTNTKCRHLIRSTSSVRWAVRARVYQTFPSARCFPSCSCGRWSLLRVGLIAPGAVSDQVPPP
ncbi:hypothetical protein EXIGLDRAFT_456801 [Exidia glandulosa HHB12029]|uniref:Uncharacterized protein n=1 Tax=Exidia glandulosa HHB12029 TaxID=1314781 RepID=A0A166BM86_EXIGL|nr:hypothetical protein EXIGLDRAFT_456801 [Exidia glandulosa HHB12029]